MTGMRSQGAVLLIAVLAMASAPQIQAADKQGGGAFSAPRPPAASSKKPVDRKRQLAPRKAASISGCVAISASVRRTKKNGKPWDVEGKRVAPDIYLRDVETNKNLQTCRDSFSCRWTLKGKSGKVSLKIMDRDLVQHDLIGSGTCSLSESSCRLGRATLRLRGC